MSTFHVVDTRSPVDINTSLFKNVKEALNSTICCIHFITSFGEYVMPPYRQTTEVRPGMNYKYWHIENYYLDLTVDNRAGIFTDRGLL